MIKKIAVAILFVFISFNQINAQFTDDFERYNYMKRISPQSLNWITWSEDPALGSGYDEDEDGIISNTDHPNHGEPKHYAASGNQALFISKDNLGSVPQDVILDLHNKSTGKWKLKWKMYLPKKNSMAYYNFQENTPVIGLGNWAIQVYFDGNGRGRIEDDRGSAIVNFSYPWKEWFKLVHIIDLDDNSIKIKLISDSGTEVIYNNAFLSNTQHLGGVDFYSIARKNIFYIDDVSFEKKSLIEDVYIRENNRWEDAIGNPLSGEPDNSYNVIIREPYDINAGETLNCLNLVFENFGRLVVANQANVVVSGDLTIPSDNKIIVGDGGSFVMLNNTATIDMIDANSFEYTRISKPMIYSDYTYWSSPVEDAKVSDFGSSAVFTYKTVNYIDLYSGKGYPQTTGIPDDHDDDGDDWAWALNTDAIVSGKGYAVLKSGNSNEQTIKFTGVPQNGYISIPVALSGNDQADDDDWNLIGNPYPSAIDAKVLIHSNINIGGTLYFWTHNTELNGGSSGPADENYNSNDYASFNLSGGVAATTGGEIPNGYIAAGQGFFMDVNNNGVITFNNDMRVINSSDENTQFFKSINSKNNDIINEVFEKENKIWLDFKGENRAFSQLLIAFLPGASNDYDNSYDGVRAGSDLNSKFYSILNDKELAIQGLPELTDDVQLPLGFYITKPESFTISIHKIEGAIINENVDIFLIDHTLNRRHNLKKGNYHFDISENGVDNNRFDLQIVNSVQWQKKIINEEDFVVVNTNGNFKIRANQKVRTLEVYDINGRLLIENKPNSKNFYLLDHKIKCGTILIFKIELEDGKVLSKKILKY